MTAKEINKLVNRINFYERKDGRLEGRLTVDGIRKSFYGATKIEIKQKARDFLIGEESNNNTDVPTLEDYAESWLNRFMLGHVEPSYYTRLRSVIKCQIKGTKLGKMRLDLITTDDIQKVVMEHANPTQKEVKALAISGIKRLLQLIDAVMEQAVREGIIRVNPSKNVLMPNSSYAIVSTKKQRTMDDNELEMFKQTCLSKFAKSGEYRSRDGLVFLLILNLGLRIGEMLALKWSNIDLDKKVVYIGDTMQSNNVSPDGRRYTRFKGTTKSPSGVRIIGLNDSVIQYIMILQEYDKRNGIKSEYVCCTSTGKNQNPQNMHRSLKRLCKRGHLADDIHLHTLRHAFGSTLLRRGVSIQVVSKLMGHKNIDITYKTYIHVLQEEEAKAMQTISIC